ncbi:MAG: hypothetical protein ABH821_02040 [archaeon]
MVLTTLFLSVFIVSLLLGHGLLFITKTEKPRKKSKQEEKRTITKPAESQEPIMQAEPLIEIKKEIASKEELEEQTQLPTKKEALNMKSSELLARMKQSNTPKNLVSFQEKQEITVKPVEDSVSELKKQILMPASNSIELKKNQFIVQNLANKLNSLRYNQKQMEEEIRELKNQLKESSNLNIT